MAVIKMSYTTQIEANIDLNLVREYLISSGWKQTGTASTTKSFIWEHPKYSQGILLPDKDTYADFNLRFAELVHTLERYENRPVPEILMEMGAVLY